MKRLKSAVIVITISDENRACVGGSVTWREGAIELRTASDEDYDMELLPKDPTAAVASAMARWTKAIEKRVNAGLIDECHPIGQS